MTELQMIQKLNELIRDAESRNLDLGFAKEFLDHGEWLLSFNEVRYSPNLKADEDFIDRNNLTVDDLHNYFGSHKS